MFAAIDTKAACHFDVKYFQYREPIEQSHPRNRGTAYLLYDTVSAVVHQYRLKENVVYRGGNPAGRKDEPPFRSRSAV